MTTSRTMTMLFAVALVAMLCSSSAAIDQMTGAFTFRVVAVENPPGVVVGYTYVLDPIQVSDFFGDIEFDSSLRFDRGNSIQSGTQFLHGVQDFVIQDNFMEGGNFISGVSGISTVGEQSGDLFQVSFGLAGGPPLLTMPPLIPPTSNDPGAPAIRFFSNPGSGHFITIDGVDCTEFDFRSDLGPTHCGPPPPDTFFTWDEPGLGSWNDGSNWDPHTGPPNDPNHTAVFDSSITADSTIVVDSPVTVNDVQFNNIHTYAIAGTKSVNLSASIAATLPTISVAAAPQGDHQFPSGGESSG